jgi:hypothetical protein
MAFLEGEACYLNENASKDLPNRIGEIAIVDKSLYDSQNFDYRVQFEDSMYGKVKESELTKLNDRQKELIKYLYLGNEVLYAPTNQKVIINKVDLVNYKVGLNFVEGGSSVVDIDKIKPLEDVEMEQPEFEKLGKFTEIAYGIGEFTDEKNKQYGSSVDATYGMITVLMERYKNDDNTYTIPQSLLQHILLQVRMMDKINRIFNNPSGEGDSESPYNDLAGYSLIGIDMVEGK